MKNVKVTSHKREVLTELERKVMLALKAIGLQAEGYAKKDCPVDTGRLQNSIANKVKGDAVYIGTNVVYAKYVEYNDHVTHVTGKAHFLRDAATTHGEEYKNIAKDILSS